MEPLLQETRVLHHPPLSAALPSKGLCLELPTSRPTGIKTPSSPASKVSNHLPTLVPLASPAAREGQEALWKGGTETRRATAAHSQIARRGGEKNRLPTPTQDSALALWTLDDSGMPCSPPGQGSDQVARDLTAVDTGKEGLQKYHSVKEMASAGF